MKTRSKRYEATVAEAPEDPLAVAEAVARVKECATAKFVESVELALRLGIDPKQSDQIVRGSFSLPHGTGKMMRVICFAEGDDAQAAEEAGAVAVGGQDLADKIQKEGWMDFDVAIAHPSMMRYVGKLGKVLGPKGLMPSPKSGTVSPDVGDAVRSFAAGKLEFRNDVQGNVHVLVGKVDFEASKLIENVEAMMGHIQSIRPAVVKGAFVVNAVLSSTMGPGVRLAV